MIYRLPVGNPRGAADRRSRRYHTFRVWFLAWFLSGRTFCTSSSQADTARTRRRYVPALRSLPRCSASAPGGWRATRGLWLCRGCVRKREARIVRSRPPASSPLRVPIRPAPPSVHRWALLITVASGSRPEGPDGSGVNGLTLGPLRLLGRLSPAGQGACRSEYAHPSSLQLQALYRLVAGTPFVTPACCPCSRGSYSDWSNTSVVLGVFRNVRIVGTPRS